MQFCCSYGGIFLCFRFRFGFSFVVELRLGGWTGVDQLPESLQAWFEVDPWYLDSLLKTWSESSTADPVLPEVLQIALQQDRWPMVLLADLKGVFASQPGSEMHRKKSHANTYTQIHPSVPQYVYMWAWRQSLNCATPAQFLRCLEELL